MLKNERTKIKACALSNYTKKETLKMVVTDFVSPRAVYIGKEYISNIFSKIQNSGISTNEMEILNPCLTI